MALNDKFNILNSRIDYIKKDLNLKSFDKNYWEEVCKKNPSKKECLIYCD